ncbi:hypothetical protein [Flavobacterium sp.]|uniref:hypothetical protein n=1 Tax=Flavobacterium sp. TaxID=239 RepID=UPI0037507A56
MKFISKYKTILLIALILFIGAFAYIKFIKKSPVVDSTGKVLTEDDYEYYNSSVKDDTLHKFGFIAKENYIVTQDADVRRTPNKAMFNTVYKLQFGTKVYTKNLDEDSKVKNINKTLLERENRNDYIAIYAKEPILLSEKPVGYVYKEDILGKDDFDKYKPKKKEIKPVAIESGLKSTIEANLYINEVEYKFSKNIERYNQSIVHGDFNNDGLRDFAVILDSFDNSNSAIQIYFNNLENNRYDLVYTKTYPSLLKIKLIGKDRDVMVNSEITKFPIDGILISNSEFNTFFHIYNTDDKSFMVMPN